MIIKDIKDIQVKTDDGWYISVRSKPYNDQIEIWFAYQKGGLSEVCYFNETGTMVLKKLNEGELDPPPTMQISRNIWDGLRQAINGIEETPQKQSVDAELKATKYHLEDMRIIAKVK